jgi:hypothetical protein
MTDVDNVDFAPADGEEDSVFVIPATDKKFADFQRESIAFRGPTAALWLMFQTQDGDYHAVVPLRCRSLGVLGKPPRRPGKIV